jgi:hypothetical protein
VYAQALAEAHIHVYERLGFFARIFKRKSRSLHGAAAFALLTCKQIRYELLPLLFPAATFNFDAYTANMLGDNRLVSYIGQHVCHSITKMVLPPDTVQVIVMDSHNARSTGTHVLCRADYFPCLEGVWVYEFGAVCCVGHATMALREIFARAGLVVSIRDEEGGEWLELDEGMVEG